MSQTASVGRPAVGQSLRLSDIDWRTCDDNSVIREFRQWIRERIALGQKRTGL